ncbi:MAG TPA: putative PEP-binding protein [Conexibacter sp.]
MSLAGLGASPGTARGPVVILRPRPLDGPPVDAPADALRTVAAELERLAGGTNAAAAEILSAQAAIAADPQLLDAASELHAGGADPVAALRDAVAPYRAALAGARSAYQRERVRDLDEILRRAIAVLERSDGVERHPPVPGILVGSAITPADTALFEHAELLGVVSGDGGDLSHVAILARSLGIPAVLGVGTGVDALAAGSWVAVDGARGTVEQLADGGAYAPREAAPVPVRQRGPARTKDGAPCLVHVNVGNRADVAQAAALGIEGAGLVRTELVFADRADAPSVDDQRAVYDDLLDELPGPVTVRLLDVGADKPLRYVAHDAGPNPALGERGVRLLLRHPQLLCDQVRALCRSRHAERIRVMLPMVARAEEVGAVRQMLEPVFEQEGRTLPLGAMVEVPAAAVCARELAREVAFLSVGTNDLLQYLFAVDRVSALTRSVIEPLPAAVWQLLGDVFEAAAAAGVEAGVCGELAADEEGCGILWALGASSLSVSPGRVADVRAALARRTAAEWKALADEVAQRESTEEHKR